MKIVTTTAITLSDEEKAALQTIKEARDECIREDFYKCEECPLYINCGCLGDFCTVVKRRCEDGQNN